MDKFWLEKARRYILEHNAFYDVSEINLVEKPEAIAVITAIASIGLPSKFIKKGITDIGVKDKEKIVFIFPKEFPSKAPIILLRNDFPRCFPHINPSDSDVIPCIYEGNLSELLQQSEWMNGILNQLIDWLEKAASNSLINSDQGWEPMRNDRWAGLMPYDLHEMVKIYSKTTKFPLFRKLFYDVRNRCIVTDCLCNSKSMQKAHALYFLTPGIICKYIPNVITNLSELYQYAKSIGIDDLRENVEKIDAEFADENKLFVVLSVKRPVRIIGSDIDIEFLNFVVHKSGHRKKKKRVLPGCKVEMLTHVAENTPELLRRLSGGEEKENGKKNIALVGCGSLGSKIGVHLARSGNGPFLCIDNDLFMPHNNARYGLTATWIENKAELLSFSISRISRIDTQAHSESALSADYSNSKIVIDTTASLSVRNFLMSNSKLPPVISAGLYERGQYGILFVENQKKRNRLINMWAHLYHQSLANQTLQKILFDSNIENVSIGQSCSSQTMKAGDAQISLMSAAMSLNIQNVIENSLPQNSEIYFYKYEKNYSMQTEVMVVPEHSLVQSITQKDWQVFLSQPVREEMKCIMRAKSPNETGGVLLGSVFLYAKTIVVTSILPAPRDSRESRTCFILGTDGLEQEIKVIERKTNGKVTYLGTWHSHPCGGGASQTDHKTYNKLLFVRNYEPTVCLIITHDDQVFMV